MTACPALPPLQVIVMAATNRRDILDPALVRWALPLLPLLPLLLKRLPPLLLLLPLSLLLPLLLLWSTTWGRHPPEAACSEHPQGTRVWGLGLCSHLLLSPSFLPCRPGRFDRIIYVGLPDYNGRIEIINVHLAKRAFSGE